MAGPAAADQAIRPPFPKRDFIGALALFAGLGVLFRFTDLDVWVARLAYAPEIPHWAGQSAAPWTWLYQFGTQPALGAGLLGLLAFLASFSDPSKKKWRGPGLYLFLLLALGPGLLVNGFGKNLAGRPRPSDLLEFGGPWEFRHAFEFGIPGRGHSFLSGHAANAFYWFGPAFLLQGQQRRWGLAAAALFGCLMSVARITQGAHFLSDTLLCGALIYALAAGLSPLISWQPRATFFRRKGMGSALLAGLGGWLLIANPIYEERRLHWLGEGQQAQPTLETDRIYHVDSLAGHAINLNLQAEACQVQVSFDGEKASPGALPLLVTERFSGSCLPAGKERFEPEIMGSSPGWPLHPGDLGISLVQRISWPFWEAAGQIEVHLPAEIACEARLKSKGYGITIGTLPKDSQVLVYGNFPSSALPAGFEAYDSKGFHKGGSGPLIVLHLDASSVRFEN